MSRVYRTGELNVYRIELDERRRQHLKIITRDNHP